MYCCYQHHWELSIELLTCSIALSLALRSLPVVTNLELYVKPPGPNTGMSGQSKGNGAERRRGRERDEGEGESPHSSWWGQGHRKNNCSCRHQPLYTHTHQSWLLMASPYPGVSTTVRRSFTPLSSISTVLASICTVRSIFSTEGEITYIIFCLTH
jgi:hypothetical protein